VAMEILTKYFTDFTEKQISQFTALKDLYADWNQKINVISRKDFDNFYLHHVLHSLSIATQFDFPGGYDIMDLGTGGGFPGIPLAILFPDANFYLVDSINKKLNVANAVADAIDLKNITVSHTRAEDIHDKKFDIVVSRAVAPLKDLCHWSKPLLKKKPVNEPKKLTGLICLKGGDLNKEIAESGCRPHTWEIEKIFEEDFFKEKYILYVTG
jgi:16S rRNA (guanine527-N7)-methyltransferase